SLRQLKNKLFVSLVSRDDRKKIMTDLVIVPNDRVFFDSEIIIHLRHRQRVKPQTALDENDRSRLIVRREDVLRSQKFFRFRVGLNGIFPSRQSLKNYDNKQAKLRQAFQLERIF